MDVAQAYAETVRRYLAADGRCPRCGVLFSRPLNWARHVAGTCTR